jgi:hypothetical protein
MVLFLFFSLLVECARICGLEVKRNMVIRRMTQKLVLDGEYGFGRDGFAGFKV